MTWTLPAETHTSGLPSGHAERPTLGRAPRRAAVLLLAVGLLCDLAVRTRVGGIAATSAVVVLCAGVATVGWVVRRGGRVLLCVAIVVSTFLALRASPWLQLLDLSVLAVAVALACSAERDARLSDSRFSVAGLRLWGAVTGFFTVTPAATRTLGSIVPGRRDGAGTARAAAVLRGLLIAVPVVGLIGINLAMADPVFGSLFSIDLNVGGLVLHVVVLLLGAWVTATFLARSAVPPVIRPARTVTVGGLEAIVVMTALTAVYAMFAWSQVLVARRGPDYVARATGLTYAEYARSGFFQLLWVAAATALTLLALRSLVVTEGRFQRRCVSALGAIASALTLVVVHAALTRLDLYEQAFGLTRLRYASSAFAWWLGAVFLLVGASFALSGRVRRDWLPAAVGCSVLIVVLVLNVANPDRTVMEHNADRYRAGATFDVSYALTLSDDAVPTLVDLVPELDPVDAAQVRTHWCANPERMGPTRWNAATWSAETAVERLCRQ